MDKTSQKVTEDLKRQERDKKLHKTYTKRLKEKIAYQDNQDKPTSSASSPTGDSTTSTSYSIGNSTPSTPLHTIRSNDTYVYGVGILAVLAIGVCVVFTYNTFQPKKLINEKQDQPPKPRHML